ncbi:MAG: hypothetical protein AAFQ81_01915 [Pseudomonadota bacterium]
MSTGQPAHNTGVADDPEVVRRALLTRGWYRFGYDSTLADWVSAVIPHARAIADDPAARHAWLRCGGTWFAGVNILPNAPDGSLPAIGDRPAVPPLQGRAIRFLRETMGHGALPLDRAQLSICYPGYPAAPQPDESEAAFRYRRNRDAAHVDGLERDAARNRRLGEAHAFILAIPVAEAGPEAAPFTIWEGSHEIMRTAFRTRLTGLPREAWSQQDVTAAYTTARREAFESCRRVTLSAAPGEAYIAHRLSLHGVAPWEATAGPGAWRPIVYFRPELPALPDGTPDFEAWLSLP